MVGPTRSYEGWKLYTAGCHDEPTSTVTVSATVSPVASSKRAVADSSGTQWTGVRWSGSLLNGNFMVMILV